MENRVNDEKKNYINLLRGLAIFLMLWGHCIQYCCGGQFSFFENGVFKFIYSFHMPLFMLISGYLFFYSARSREMVELIEHKGKSLLYPILMCSVVNFILTSAVKAVITGEYKKLIAGIPFDSLWFLWSVLSCSIAVAFAVKLSKNRVIQVLLFAAGLIIVAILPTYEMNLYMYPYFIIGYIYAENEDGWKPAAKMISVISIVAFAVMLVFFEKKYYIYTSGLLGGTTLTESLIIDLYRWAIGLFGSISIAFICGLIYRFIKNWRLTRDIEYLGQNSIAAYALSVSLLSSWLPAIAKRVLELLPWIDWNKCMWLYNLVVTPIVAVFYAVLLQLIIKLLKKGKAFRLIFGR